MHWQALFEGALSESSSKLQLQLPAKEALTAASPIQRHAEISSPSLGKAWDNERLRVTHEPDPKSSEARRVPIMAVHKLQSHIVLTKICLYVEMGRCMRGRSLPYPSEHFTSSVFHTSYNTAYLPLTQRCWGQDLAPHVVTHYRSGQTCYQLSSP